MQEVENPKLVLIVGCIGLGLNILVMSALHGKSSCCLMIDDTAEIYLEHDHSHGHSHSHARTHDDNQVHHDSQSHELGWIETPASPKCAGNATELEAGVVPVSSVWPVAVFQSAFVLTPLAAYRRTS